MQIIRAQRPARDLLERLLQSSSAPAEPIVHASEREPYLARPHARERGRRSRDMAPRRRMSPSVDGGRIGIPTRATTRDHAVRHPSRACGRRDVFSVASRRVHGARAREALAHGAHESAARWASLALSRRDVDDEGEGAAVASGRTSDGWRRDAIDLEIKGDALAARGDARGAAARTRATPPLPSESRRRGGRASASGRDAMDGDEMSGDEMTMKLVRTLMKIGDEEAVREAKECFGITPGNRTLENRLLAAKIARREGHVRAAVSAYKEVLAKWPFAIEAVVALAELGVKSMDARRRSQKDWRPRRTSPAKISTCWRRTPPPTPRSRAMI